MADLIIQPIKGLNESQSVKTAQKSTEPKKGEFGQWLRQSLSEVNDLQMSSDKMARRLITGASKDIHGTMIAAQKAGIAIELTMQIRNKVIAAYDEIKRMQF